MTMSKHTPEPERVAAMPRQTCCICKQPVGRYYYRLPVPEGHVYSGWASNLSACRKCARATSRKG